MFGCLAIYVEDKIVLILRDKRDQTADNGVWLATTEEHHQSLRREFPNMRSIQVLGKKVTGWQVLPTDAEDFEEAALRACELILARDPRIGKVPGRRARSGAKKAANDWKRAKTKRAAKVRRQVVSRVQSLAPILSVNGVVSVIAIFRQQPHRIRFGPAGEQPLCHLSPWTICDQIPAIFVSGGAP